MQVGSLDWHLRAEVQDWKVVGDLGQDITIGSAFAFLQNIAAPSVRSWHRNKKAAHRVIPLLGMESVELPSVQLAPVPLPELRLSAVLSDQVLYYENGEVPRLLVMDLRRPDMSVLVTYRQGYLVIREQSVLLNSDGMAMVEAYGLGCGEYEVRLASESEDGARFTVAQYQLSPLLATLMHQDLRAARKELAIRLKLETYGVPVSGPVTVELVEAGRPGEPVQCTSQDGLLETVLSLSGAGPYSLNLQALEDPTRTATVALVGSRRAERTLTTFGRLGDEVTGSLLPRENSREVRGIHLKETGYQSTPFRIEGLDTRSPRLIVQSPATCVEVVVVDALYPGLFPSAQDPRQEDHSHFQACRKEYTELYKSGRKAELRAILEGETRGANDFYTIACCQVHEGLLDDAVVSLRQALRTGLRDLKVLEKDKDLAPLAQHPGFEYLKRGPVRRYSFDSLSEGQTIELEVAPPLSFILIGAFLEETPWEGWSAVLAPSTLQAEVKVPERLAPGSQVPVEVHTNLANQGSVWLRVRDRRLGAQDTPQSRLASQIKSTVEAASQRFGLGEPRQKLAFLKPGYKAPASWPGGGGGGGPLLVDLLPTRPRGSHRSLLSSLFARSERIRQALPSAPSPLSVEARQGPEWVEDTPFDLEGAAYVALLPLCDGRASTLLRLPDQDGEYAIEAFVVCGLEWSSASSTLQVRAEVALDLELPAFMRTQDVARGRLLVRGSGGPWQVSLTRDGAEVCLTPSEIADLPAEYTFNAAPGLWRAEVSHGGRVFTASRLVSQPDRLVRIVRRLRFLEPGQTLRRSEVDGATGLRVLRDAIEPLRTLSLATQNYGFACSEQTAAKISAASLSLLTESDPALRARAEMTILTGLRWLDSMWMEDQGFKLYPSSPQVDWSVGPLVSWHLLHLMLVPVAASQVQHPRLLRAIQLALKMATDAMLAYGTTFPPPHPHSFRDAWATLKFSQDTVLRQRSLNWVREHTPDLRVAGASQPAAVAERAYGAASLLHTGEELSLALELANDVVSRLNHEGRLHGTLDSLSAIALLSQMRDTLAAGTALVEVDGRSLPIQEAAFDCDCVTAVDGVTIVEVSQRLEESWEGQGNVEVVARALQLDGTEFDLRAGPLYPGQRWNLLLELPEGYQAGDLAWIGLPPALAWLHGGGQVRRLVLDFEGESVRSVALVVTQDSLDVQGKVGDQHLLVSLRNMYDPERSSPLMTLCLTVSDQPLCPVVKKQALLDCLCCCSRFRSDIDSMLRQAQPASHIVAWLVHRRETISELCVIAHAGHLAPAIPTPIQPRATLQQSADILLHLRNLALRRVEGSLARGQEPASASVELLASTTEELRKTLESLQQWQDGHAP